MNLSVLVNRKHLQLNNLFISESQLIMNLKIGTALKMTSYIWNFIFIQARFKTEFKMKPWQYHSSQVFILLNSSGFKSVKPG